MDRNQSSRPLVTNTFVVPIPKPILCKVDVHKDEDYEDNPDSSICAARSMNTMGASERDLKVIGEL